MRKKKLQSLLLFPGRVGRMLCNKKNFVIVSIIYIITIVLFFVGVNFCHVSSLEYRSSFLLPFFLIMYAVPAYLIGCCIHKIPIRNNIQKDNCFILEPYIHRLCNTVFPLVIHIAGREKNEVWVSAINERRISTRSASLLCGA